MGFWSFGNFLVGIVSYEHSLFFFNMAGNHRSSFCLLIWLATHYSLTYVGFIWLSACISLFSLLVISKRTQVLVINNYRFKLTSIFFSIWSCYNKPIICSGAHDISMPSQLFFVNSLMNLPYRSNSWMLSPISLSENLIFQLSLNPSPFGVKNLGYDNGASLSIVKSQSVLKFGVY
jgi:hypothetical protein